MAHEPWVVVVMYVEPKIHAMVPVSTRTVCISIGTVHPFCQRDEGVPKPGPHTHILKLHCNKDLVPGIRIDRHRHGTIYTLGTHSVHDIAKLLFYQYFYISPFLSILLV